MWCLCPPEMFTGCASPGSSFCHQHYLRGGGLLEQLRNGSSLIAAAQIEPYWQNNCVEYFPFSLVWWCERRLWAGSMQEKETGRFPASQSAHERAARIETWLTASICLQFITMWRGIMLDTSLKGKSWQTGAIYSRLFLTDSNCIDWSLIQMCCHPRCWADEWKNSGSRPSIQFHSEPIFFFLSSIFTIVCLIWISNGTLITPHCSRQQKDVSDVKCICGPTEKHGNSFLISSSSIHRDQAHWHASCFHVWIRSSHSLSRTFSNPLTFTLGFYNRGRKRCCLVHSWTKATVVDYWEYIA